MVFLYSYVRLLVQITHERSEDIIGQKYNNKGGCNCNRSPQNDQRMTLTYKLRGTKDVFEIVAKIDLVGQAKVNELNARMGHAPVQQHDVLWLRERERNKYKVHGLRTFDTYRKKHERGRYKKSRKSAITHGNHMQSYRNIH